jgi:hypothetical protein
MDLEIYKKNQKTAYLAERYETLIREEGQLSKLADKDPGLKEMADEELSRGRG